MAVVTQRTVNTVLAGSKVISMRPLIDLLEPDAAPLTTILLKTATDNVDNSTYYHREQELRPRFVTAQNAYTTSLTLNTTDATYVQAGDVLYNTRTKSLERVTSVATPTATVVQGVGGSTSATGAVGDELYIVGSSFLEDATAPNAIMTTEVLKTFYTQIFKDTCRVTKTAVATRMYHGNDRLFQQKMKMIEHKIKMELSCLFGGTGAVGTVSGSTTVLPSYTAGLIGWITTNQIDVGGAFTRPILWDAVRRIAEYHMGDYLLLASPMTISVISGWGMDNIQISPNAKEWGLSLNRIITPFGNVDIANERLLKGNVLSGYAFLLPLPISNFIKYRPLVGNGEDRDTKLLTNIKTDDDPDYYKDEIKTEAGFEFFEEKKMAILTGITG
jgi:hypothetical protein